MNKSKKELRSQGEGAVRNTTRDFNHTGIDPLLGWFSLGKPSRISRQPKREWKRGRK